jgi:hypothetical protein
MRAFLPALLLSIFTLFSSSGNATDRPRQIAALSNPEPFQAPTPSEEKYRGYYSDLSQIAGRQDFATMVEALRQQLDIAESVRLPPNVLAFFHTIPFVVDELTCVMADDPKSLPSACYSQAPVNLKRRSVEPTVWDSKTHQWTNENPVNLAEDTKRGVVMVHPNMLVATNSQNPILLHELLHAYHNVMIPEGSKNPAIVARYNDAKGAQLYPGAYVMKNEREFFAVTASVFLYGKASQEPFTRSNLKQKQPDYYNYLVWLFGFDPDRGSTATPVASAE